MTLNQHDKASVEVFDGAVTGEWPDHISPSQYASWHTCRRKCALSTACRLHRKDATPSKGMLAGSVIHQVLGHHYRTPPGERSHDRLIQLLDAYKGDIGDARAACQKMLGMFWRKFGTDGIVPEETEQRLQVQLPPVSGLDSTTFLGYADLVYERDGFVVVEDYKTSLSAIPDPTLYTTMLPQGFMYVWAKRQRVTKPVLMSWLLLTPYSCRRVETPYSNTDEVPGLLVDVATEQRTLPLRPHYSMGCRWCEYRALCETHRTGGDVKMVLDEYETFGDVDNEGEAE